MITQAKVREVKRYLKCQWRDQQWYDMMTREESTAILFALDEVPYPKHLRDVVSEAKKYMQALIEFRIYNKEE